MENERESPRRPRILSSAERRQRAIPLSFQLSGMGLKLLSLIPDEWASDVLARFCFTVFKSKPRPWVAEFWQQADRRIEVAAAD